MTDKEILAKVIEKAENNGYKTIISIWDFNKAHYEDLRLDCGEWDSCWNVSVRDIIFSHEFAKAFWGDITIGNNGWFPMETWAYHLQKMVLEKEPLKYLENFL